MSENRSLTKQVSKGAYWQLPWCWAEVGSLGQGLRDDGSSLGSSEAVPFSKILGAGNPWRRKHLRRRLVTQGMPAVSFQLG